MSLAGRLKVRRLQKELENAMLRGDTQAHTKAAREMAALRDPAATQFLTSLLQHSDPQTRATARESLLTLTDPEHVRTAVITAAIYRLAHGSAHVHNEAAGGAMAAAQQLGEARTDLDAAAIMSALAIELAVTALAELADLDLPEMEPSLLEEAKAAATQAAMAAAPSEVSPDDVDAIASDETGARAFADAMATAANEAFQTRLYHERDSPGRSSAS